MCLRPCRSPIWPNTTAPSGRIREAIANPPEVASGDASPGPKNTREASLQAPLGGFAIAYLMRPLGAVVFGHIGDRQGRRHMLLLSVALMTAAMAATALLPTYAEIGPAAGVLLILLRCVMGFSVGGEYTGVVAYLLEGAPEHRRGLVASSASAASEVGALL